MFLKFQMKKMLVSAVLILTCVFLSISCSSLSQSRSVNEYREFDTSSVQGVRINAISENIVVHPSTGNKITVSLTGSTAASEVLFKTNIEGGVLVVECRQEMLWGMDDLTVTVTVPTVHVSNFFAKAVSGEININGFTSDTFFLEATSGEISARDIKGNTEAYSVSGDIDISYVDQAYKTKAESVSGAITVAIPENNARFAFKTDTVSGDQRCAFSYAGSLGDGMVGNGGTEISLKTVSGDISIDKK